MEPTPFDAKNFTRIICRKLPPNITEEKFLSIDIIQKVIKENNLTVQFYTTEDIGETSAPNTSIAIISGADIPKDFVQQLTEIKLELPFGGFAKPQVEFAPIHFKLPTKKYTIKQVPPIDEDQEFIDFSKNYKAKTVIPTDKLIPVSSLGTTKSSAESEIFSQFSASIRQTEAKSKKEKNKKGKKKNKK